LIENILFSLFYRLNFAYFFYVQKTPAWMKQNPGVASRASRDLEAIAKEDKSIEASKYAQ
jgi:hypothetical protein